MEYLIADLIDSRNCALYDEVVSNVPVELETSDDDGWGAIIRNGKGIISYAATQFPISSFTHELLHLRCDYSGMRNPGFTVRFSISPAPEKQDEIYNQIKEQAAYIYNQLIHHKIYYEFISLGFPPDEFLNDNDAVQSLDRARKDIQEFKKIRKNTRKDITCNMFIYPYLLLTSPNDQSIESQSLLKELRNISDQSFYKINNLISQIKNDKTPDMCTYLAKIFKFCDRPDVGFGYSEDKLVWAGEV